MSEMKSVPGILEVIGRITSNSESGRLEINTSGTFGTLLFHAGKLVDARLGSLSGFQAVNAAVALRDVEFSFDHVEPASHVSTISPSERVVLKRFFGIEAAEVEEPKDTLEPEMGWNETPEKVVPLTESETIPVALFAKPRLAVAVFFALVLGLAVGTVVMRATFKSRQQAPTVASAVEAKASVVEPEPNAPAEPQAEVKQIAGESSAAAVSEQPGTASQKSRTAADDPVASSEKTSTRSETPVANAERSNTPAKNDSSSADVTAAPPKTGEAETRAGRDAKVESNVDVRNLNGEWRVINTVEKTGYRRFDNLEVGFRLTINQNGKDFTAKGEKFFENGQTLPVHRRTPIQVTGTIDGDRVVATFIEDGRMRRTNGRFVWKLQNGGDGLAGTFVSTAANTSGRSAVTKH